jgi:hypothetical protein
MIVLGHQRPYWDINDRTGTSMIALGRGEIASGEYYPIQCRAFFDVRNGIFSIKE